jgi:hypothetical protein
VLTLGLVRAPCVGPRGNGCDSSTPHATTNNGSKTESARPMLRITKSFPSDEFVGHVSWMPAAWYADDLRVVSTFLTVHPRQFAVVTNTTSPHHHIHDRGGRHPSRRRFDRRATRPSIPDQRSP